MSILGIADGDMRFLGLPDLGLTDRLMGADAAAIDALRTQIAEAAPTLLVMPALGDCHPDHSAANILARLALAQSTVEAPRILEFAVHGEASATEGVAVASSTAAERNIKQAAILAHTSQMRLSRRRFLRYAVAAETYRLGATTSDARHPLRAQIDDAGRLQVRIDTWRWNASLRGQTVFVVMESEDGVRARWLIRLDPHSGSVPVFDCISRRMHGSAQIQRQSGAIVLTLASNTMQGRSQGFVKLGRPQPGLRIFDRFGWQKIEFPERNPASA